MAKVTPAQGAEKWANRLGGATEDIRRGVEAVSQSPGELAVRNAQAYIQNVQASFAKWQRNTRRVTLDEWKQAMLNKGLSRVAQGAQANQGKMESFLTEFLPFQDRVTSEVRGMPKVTLEDSIARMTAQVRKTAAFKRGGGS